MTKDMPIVKPECVYDGYKQLKCKKKITERSVSVFLLLATDLKVVKGRQTIRKASSVLLLLKQH